MPSDPARVAAEVGRRLLAAGPTLGSARLVCVDGPAGSGKTTLADALTHALPGSTVVHCDEMLQGWRGLPGLAATVADLLAPLAVDRPGTWRRWDWLADGWAESHVVDPGGVLVLEGVGSWSPAIAHLVGVLVWVEADSTLRLRRGIARDGEQMRPQWEQWRLDEDALFATLGTRQHADVLVDTDGSVQPAAGSSSR
ncbi:nucleoside/nucleotide kinase family protein [Nocardioides okcheonensis]|uniref:4-amino-4-deoxy-L-arabinose transferase n=1 Tax=Nocardioides okcheonensis TaxID=2894081 RepID=UPI001E53AD9E|nr:4-amino-4-deoxy-L-arabinose transferase [Nocardioides okcheonensis]UFN45280.1 4-amino-4-deoxy-L-arabinose transferase [Nocardioides okcheonensis]